MSQFIENSPIKNKMIIIVMTTVVASLLLVGTAVVLSERYMMKQSMHNKVETFSRIIADRSTASLSFGDQKSAAETLLAFSHESTVVLACIYDQSQMLFSAYTKTQSLACPEKSQQEQHFYSSEFYELYKSIILDSETIGTVYLRVSLSEFDDRLIQFVVLIISIILVASILAYFMANKQQVVISGPILELADIAKKISMQENYFVQLPKGTNDEIGILNRAFKDMLEQLYSREVSRDEAENALIEREYNLTITLNSIGDAVIATDDNGNITRMNPVAEKMTGWSFQDAEGQALKTIFIIINASTREPIENPVDKVLATGETVHLSNHTTLISKDGTEYQIDDSAAPIRDSDELILGMVLVFNDVTEAYRLRENAKALQLQFQRLFDDMQTMIIITTAKGTVKYANNTPLKIVKIELDDVLEKKIWDCAWFDYDSSVQAIVQNDCTEVLAGQNILRDIQIATPDGLLWIAYSIHPVLNAEGEVIQLLHEGRDVSKRLQQEEQLRRTQKMDALGKLTGGIAHDYNNMLGVVIGYAELLEGELGDQPELAEYVHEISHAGKRGAKLTRKLLSFSRLKSVAADMLDINTLLQDEQNMLEKTLTARIRLVFELAEDLWPVWVDGGELEDCVINLCINAMHAIEGSGQLTLRTYNEKISPVDAQLLTLKAGEYVALSLTDTGCGMDESIKEHIFEPFYSTKGEAGTGLGLSQVYGFVNRSGGTIKVYSEPDHGTQFILYFPRYSEPDDEDEAVDEQPETDLRGTETILVVDDEPALLALTGKVLGRQGYRVLRAERGEQALEILKTESIDLLLSDVIMPEMDGYQLAKIVQEQYPTIKIQLVSGFADSRHVGLVDDILHQQMIHKPYDSQTLLQRIRELLDSEEE